MPDLLVRQGGWLLPVLPLFAGGRAGVRGAVWGLCSEALVAVPLSLG